MTTSTARRSRPSWLPLSSPGRASPFTTRPGNLPARPPSARGARSRAPLRAGGYALTYFRIAAFGLLPAMLAVAGQGYMRGVSNLRRPFEIVVVANLANVILELLFVYGFHWGISGSAAGTAIAQVGMGAAFLV